MRIGTKTLAGRLLGYAWLSALGGALLVSALTTDRRARQQEEYPCCCDPFGYLQMAQDIRHAAARGTRPRFVIESSHTRLLIEEMKAHKVPLALWQHMVAPLAYHYFPQSDRVGVQYPPGTGLMLALFPQGEALHGLDRLVIALFLAGGFSMLIVAAFKRAWVAAGFFVLSLQLGLEILARIGNASFSINAMLAPMLLCGLCLFAAASLRKDRAKTFWTAWGLTFVAGLLFGFVVLVRLPVVFILPGVLVLMWPDNWRAWYKSAWPPFLLGVLMGGLLPLFIHQSRLAGAWYLATYPEDDTALPGLAHVWPNILYYFGPGKASTELWALVAALLGCVGLFLFSGRRAPTATASPFISRLSWQRLIAAAVLIWGLSAAYFLTHETANHYYLVPATFGTVLVLGLGAFGVETGKHGTGWPRRAIQFAVLALALAPGLVAIQRAWSNYVSATAERRPPPFMLPVELADENAWVWAGELSGTLWYYARKPAHKVNGTDTATRALVYEFVLRRGEPQYIVGDDLDMKAVVEEIPRLGGTLELRGQVEGKSYYLIHWPVDGPVRQAGGH